MYEWLSPPLAAQTCRLTSQWCPFNYFGFHLMILKRILIEENCYWWELLLNRNCRAGTSSHFLRFLFTSKLAHFAYDIKQIYSKHFLAANTSFRVCSVSTKKLTSHQTPSPRGIQGEPRKTEMTTMMMMLVVKVMMMRWDDHHHDDDCDLWQICEESNGENRENVTEYCAARCSWTACHRHYDDDDDDDDSQF